MLVEAVVRPVVEVKVSWRQWFSADDFAHTLYALHFHQLKKLKGLYVRLLIGMPLTHINLTRQLVIRLHRVHPA